MNNMEEKHQYQKSNHWKKHFSKETYIHKRMETEEKTFTCPQCGKFFVNKENLNVHIRSHAEEKPFTCRECRSSFRFKEHLEIHESFHAEEKPFKCLHCAKSFMYKENLQNHVRVHTGEKPFTCPQCGKSFAYKGNLKIHLRLHTGEKPFICPQCGKKFRYSGDLKGHLKIHSGEYVYACCVCEKGFADKRTLRYHQRMHSKDKQPIWGEDATEHLVKNLKAHSSSECGEVFSEADDWTQNGTDEKPDRGSHRGNFVPASEILKAHGSVQTIEKTYPCTSCGMNFSTSIYLLAHVKRRCPDLSQ